MGIKGRGSFGINTKFADNLIFAQFNQVGGGKFLAEFFFQDIGVLVADDKGNKRANVAKNGVLDGFVKLGHILIGHNQVEVEFAGFG